MIRGSISPSRGFLVALLLGVALDADSAWAFELLQSSSGAELRRFDPRLNFDAVFDLGDPAGEALARAYRRALDRWATQSQGRIRPRWWGPTAAATGDDGRATLVADPNFNANFGDPARTVAHLELFYDVDDGRIRDSDLHLNDERFDFGGGEAGTFDAESVILHELGHALGLAHTCGDPGRTYPSCFSVPDQPPGRRTQVLEAVMAPTLSLQTVRRALTDDDRAGLGVHHVGSATISRPEILGLDGCRGLEARGFDPGDLAYWRYGSGALQAARVVPQPEGPSRRTLEPEPQRDQGDVDVILVDAQGQAYDAWVAWSPPSACPGDPDPNLMLTTDAGCGCSTSRAGGRQGPLLLFTLIAVTMALVRRRAWWAAALLVSFLPSSAWAYKCSRVALDTGPSLVWAKRTIPWVVDPNALNATGDRAVGEADLKASFDAWTAIDCSDIDLPYMGEVPGVRAELVENGANVNAVVWVGTGWAYDAGAIAVTTTAYDRASGVVVDADIELNGQHFQFGRADSSNCRASDGFMDLRNTVTHEVGHVLGLDHPPNTPRYAESTMYASAPPCETKKRSLAADDREGICTIYPQGAATVQCFPPNGPSFLQVDSDDGYGCRSVGLGAPAWWVLAGLIFWRRRRG